MSLRFRLYMFKSLSSNYTKSNFRHEHPHGLRIELKFAVGTRFRGAAQENSWLDGGTVRKGESLSPGREREK